MVGNCVLWILMVSLAFLVPPGYAILPAMSQPEVIKIPEARQAGLPQNIGFHGGSCNVGAAKYQLKPLVFSEQQARDFFDSIIQSGRELSHSDVAAYLEIATITGTNILLSQPWRKRILDAIRSGDSDVLDSILIISSDFLSTDSQADILIKEAYSNRACQSVLVRIHISQLINVITDVRLRRNILNQNVTSILMDPAIHVDWIAGYNQGQTGLDPGDQVLRSKIIKGILAPRAHPTQDDYAGLFLEAYFSPKNLTVINELLTIMENDWDAPWDFLRVFSENASVKSALTRKLQAANKFTADSALTALADSPHLTKPEVMKLLNHPDDDIGMLTAAALKILARRWGYQADVQEAIARGLFRTEHYACPGAIKALGEMKSSSFDASASNSRCKTT